MSSVLTADERIAAMLVLVSEAMRSTDEWHHLVEDQVTALQTKSYELVGADFDVAAGNILRSMDRTRNTFDITGTPIYILTDRFLPNRVLRLYLGGLISALVR